LQSIEALKKTYVGKKLLVRGREGKTKVFLYSEFNKDLLRKACDEYLIHNPCNLTSDGYYIGTVTNIYVDNLKRKRIKVEDMKFLSDSPIGLVDIEPHLYSSYQVENFLGRKVNTKSEILMLMMLLESSISRPIIVVPQSFKMFARILEDYNSDAWGDMWENIFSLQVMNYQTTRYPNIKDLQVILMDEFGDLEFNYEAFVTDLLGDTLPTEMSMKGLEYEIGKLLYTDDDDPEYLSEILGDYL